MNRIKHRLNSEPALKQNYVLIHTGFVFKPLSLIYSMSSCHETLPASETKYWQRMSRCFFASTEGLRAWPTETDSSAPSLLQSVDGWRPQNLHSQVIDRHRIHAARESYGDKDTQRQWWLTCLDAGKWLFWKLWSNLTEFQKHSPQHSVLLKDGNCRSSDCCWGFERHMVSWDLVEGDKHHYQQACTTSCHLYLVGCHQGGS